MFGYVNIYKDELKIKEYNLFKAYYCGLCKALGKQYNQLVRLGLNYDFTFLAIMADALSEEAAFFSKEGCIKNFSKKAVVTSNAAVSFAADMSVILTYYKLVDDIKDDKSIKAAMAIIPFWFAKNRLKGKYSQIISSVKDNLSSLSEIESKGTVYPDEAAHPFALIMQDMFEYICKGSGKLGYNIGRYVYLADACDDMQKDFEKGRFNVLCSAYGYKGAPDESVRASAEDTLYRTLAAIGYEYEALPKFKNREILDNIIYLGTRFKTDTLLKKIMSKTERKKNNE